MEEVPGTPESELFCSCQMASLSCFFSFLFLILQFSGIRTITKRQRPRPYKDTVEDAACSFNSLGNSFCSAPPPPAVRDKEEVVLMPRGVRFKYQNSLEQEMGQRRIGGSFCHGEQNQSTGRNFSFFSLKDYWFSKFVFSPAFFDLLISSGLSPCGICSVQSAQTSSQIPTPPHPCCERVDECQQAE